MIRNSRLGLLLVALVTVLLASCATKMTEEDKLLWNDSTNAPAGRH